MNGEAMRLGVNIGNIIVWFVHTRARWNLTPRARNGLEVIVLVRRKYSVHYGTRRRLDGGTFRQSFWRHFHYVFSRSKDGVRWLRVNGRTRRLLIYDADYRVLPVLPLSPGTIYYALYV